MSILLCSRIMAVPDLHATIHHRLMCLILLKSMNLSATVTEPEEMLGGLFVEHRTYFKI